MARINRRTYSKRRKKDSSFKFISAMRARLGNVRSGMQGLAQSGLDFGDYRNFRGDFRGLVDRMKDDLASRPITSQIKDALNVAKSEYLKPGTGGFDGDSSDTYKITKA